MMIEPIILKAIPLSGHKSDTAKTDKLYPSTNCNESEASFMRSTHGNNSPLKPTEFVMDARSPSVSVTRSQ